jgi:RNA polymerase sigma-70 factor (ECF subfamily)
MDIAELFVKHKNDVFRFALTFVRDCSLAEDITQDVFVTLVQNREGANSPNPAKIKSWLMTCTKNTALNMIRKRSREAGESPENLENLESASTSDKSDLEFFAMLDCLDDTDRQIVTLHIVSGLKHHETARVLELKPGTVRQRYARALKSIKEEYLK